MSKVIAFLTFLLPIWSCGYDQEAKYSSERNLQTPPSLEKAPSSEDLKRKDEPFKDPRPSRPTPPIAKPAQKEPTLPEENPQQPHTPTPELSPLELGLGVISKETLEDELYYITRDEFSGRLSGTQGNTKIADFIIEELSKHNVQPIGSNYRQTFRIKNGPTKGQNTSNIIAKIEGNDPHLKKEHVVIGAHMDHAGTLQLGYTCSRGLIGSNNICNGADDNGSGTIAVLNIMRAISKVREHIKRSIVFIWFSGEELGLEGSWHYIQNPLIPIRDTVYMINMDMVGYMKTYGQRLAALGGETSADAANIIRAINNKYDNIEIRLTAQAGGGSDHVPFMSRGIPGVFFHTGVNNNPNYHRTSDTPERVDYDGMYLATKIAFETLFEVSRIQKNSFIAAKSEEERPSLVTAEEMTQSCHDLILNPFAEEIYLDFTEGNQGKPLRNQHSH